MITKILSRKHINTMVNAVRMTKLFDIERTPETIVIKHIRTGKEVFRSLRHGPSWITRYHKRLFLLNTEG